MQSPLRTAAAGLIGNVLEWFDYAVYFYLATELGDLFLPASLDAYTRKLFTYGIVGLGFAARIVGALVLGIVGDRIGRRALLTLSIMLMGGATLAIGLLPTYSSIGIAAPLLLLLLRLVQGFSLGGEFTGSMVYTTELASPLLRGLIASSTAAGTTLGFLLGALTVYLLRHTLGDAALYDWAWRLPFIGSVLFCFLGWILRKGIHESEQGEKAAAARPPIFKSLVADRKPILQTFGIVALTNMSYYLALTYGVDLRKGESDSFMAATIITLVVMLFAKFGGGWLSDRVGRRRLMVGLSVILVGALYPGVYLMVTGSPIVFGIGQLMIGIPVAMALGLQGAMVVEIFPLRTRVTSMSFAYNVTLLLTGGGAGVAGTWLTEHFHSSTAPAYYAMVFGLIGLPILMMMRETNQRSLA